MEPLRAPSTRLLRLSLGTPAALVLAVSSVGLGADGSASKASAPSIMEFPNVTVISIPGECPADDHAGMVSMRAFIDPQTGELRHGTPEEEAELAQAIRSTRHLQTESVREVMVSDDGALTIVLDDDSLQDVVVRVGSDGKPAFLCVPASETLKAMTAPVAPKASAEEK